jgi:hypothetical protein
VRWVLPKRVPLPPHQQSLYSSSHKLAIEQVQIRTSS